MVFCYSLLQFDGDGTGDFTEKREAQLVLCTLILLGASNSQQVCCLLAMYKLHTFFFSTTTHNCALSLATMSNLQFSILVATTHF